MQIHEWLAEDNLNQSQFARMLGISTIYASYVVRGRRRLAPEKAARVVELSGGRVSLTEALALKRGLGNAKDDEAESV